MKQKSKVLYDYQRIKLDPKWFPGYTAIAESLLRCLQDVEVDAGGGGGGRGWRLPAPVFCIP